MGAVLMTTPIPAPPPGFVLEEPQAHPAPAQAGAIPPPPKGFVLEEAAPPPAAKSQPPANQMPLVGAWLDKPRTPGSKLINSVAGKLDRAGEMIGENVKGARWSDLYEVPATVASGVISFLAGAAKDLVLNPGDAISGRLDPTSEEGMNRIINSASIIAPGSPATAARLVRTPVPPQIAQDATRMGVNLTAAQRSGNPALYAAEDAMLGGARGPQAQNIAQAARTAQEAEILAARDNIGTRVGEAADGTQIRLDRPADAGGIVGQRVADVAGQAERSLGARNAALQAERDALFRGAETASESMGARFNPQGFAPVETGGSVASATRASATRAKEGYQQSYKDTFAREGEIAPEFFTGVNKPGSQSVTAPGAPINQFAAPISTRIHERLLSLPEPIIPDATITPLASKTLNDLDRVAGLNLGRIGNPTAGQEISGVNLRGVEQARKIITGRINAAKNNPQAGEDLRALRGIATAFDEQLERGFDSALFKGDSAVLDAMKGARAEFSKYQQTFKQRARGDDAGAAIQKIVERNATPEEVSNYILGSSRVGDNGLSVRLYGRLKEALGPDAPQLQQIRGAAWEKLTAGADAATPAGAQKLAQSIREFATGRGSTLAKEMFSPEELASMQRYSSALESFSAMAKSKVHKVEAEGAIKTLIDVANQKLSPENMASSLFGHGNKVTPTQHRLVDAVGDIVGRNGPEWAAIRQGQWQRLTGTTEGALEMGAQKMSQRLHEFLNGEGKSMAEKLYSQAELTEMRKLAAIQKARIAPPGTTNPSNSGNRLAGMARQAVTGVATMLGASQGGWAGAAVGMGVGKGIETISGLRAAAQAKRLFSAPDGVRPSEIGRSLGVRGAASTASDKLTLPSAVTLLPGQGKIGEQR